MAKPLQQVGHGLLICAHNLLPAAPIVAVKIAPLAHTFPMVSLTTPSFPPVKRVLSNLT